MISSRPAPMLPEGYTKILLFASLAGSLANDRGIGNIRVNAGNSAVGGYFGGQQHASGIQYFSKIPWNSRSAVVVERRLRGAVRGSRIRGARHRRGKSGRLEYRGRGRCCGRPRNNGFHQHHVWLHSGQFAGPIAGDQHGSRGRHHGNGQAINGASAFQGIQVDGTNAPTVNISNLTITNTAAIGGNGQNGQNGYYSGGLSYGSGGGGGGGLGAGGGLLVGSGANVTISNVTFAANTATGGTGGNGGSAQNAAADPINGGNGGAGGAGNNGGASGGGGAGGSGGKSGTQGTGGTAGAAFGDGGGGGGGSGTTNSTTYTSNNPGGTGRNSGGNGGSGGDGATNASGAGGPGPGADGGAAGNGGAANGGAIYVATAAL